MFRKIFIPLNKALFEIPILSVSLIRALYIYAALFTWGCGWHFLLPDGDKTITTVFSVCAEAGGKKLRSTVQRSTETGLAVEMRHWMTRQASRESTDGSMNSYSSEGKWVRPPVLCVSSRPCQRPPFHSHSLPPEMGCIWLFIPREIGLGMKYFALMARC